MTVLGSTSLDVFALCLGGNVFGWSANEAESFAVLDAYAAAGGNFIDTADVYSTWAPGNVGGESEAIIGRWMAARGNRDEMIIATKVGQLPGAEGLSGAVIARAAEASLDRLQTDRIDLYWAHIDDPTTPQEETLVAFDTLVRAGKVRYIGASQHTGPRLTCALQISARENLVAYVAVQQEYNLITREIYEGELMAACVEQGIAFLPFWSLARGFLTGKYRAGGPPVQSVRAGAAAEYLDDAQAIAVLVALDEIARARGTTASAVALAWLATRPMVAAPIASARTAEQLSELLSMADLALSPQELDRLTSAGQQADLPSIAGLETVIAPDSVT